MRAAETFKDVLSGTPSAEPAKLTQQSPALFIRLIDILPQKIDDFGRGL
jgi:hypothetical protein